MRWPTRSHRSTHQWTWSYVHVQLVSLLQWRAQSRPLRWASRSVSLLQWHCQCDDLSSHRSTHQWTWSYIHVQLVSLLQWHLPSMRWPIYSHRSIYQWIDLPTRSRATSEPATIDISILHKTKKIHSCEHESLKGESNVTILATHLRW